MPKSIEEQVEDWGKKQLKKTKYYTKTEIINPEIEKALKIAPSKKGGNGSNFPDIKLFIQTKSLRKIPVMVEVKGKKGALIKVNASNEIDNIKKDGSPNFTNINKYALPGSRAYLTMTELDNSFEIEFSNISEVPMDFTSEEITERFVRGDKSRSKQGSGLGLAIARSFTEAQGGLFDITIDCDLFKVKITFPKSLENQKGIITK